MKYIVSYYYKVFESREVEAKDEKHAIRIVSSVTPEIEIDSIVNAKVWNEND